MKSFRISKKASRSENAFVNEVEANQEYGVRETCCVLISKSWSWSRNAIYAKTTIIKLSGTKINRRHSVVIV